MSIPITKIFFLLTILVLFNNLAYSSDFLEHTQQLKSLKELPKTHYSWPLSHDLLNKNNYPLSYELARITHSLCISGEWVTEEIYSNVVYICGLINQTNPKIPCSIGINYSPWHRKFGKDLPPTDRGISYWEEINYFEKRLNLIKKWLGAYNKKYGSKVEVSAILLDCERFHVAQNNKLWNESICLALDVIHIRAKAIFPKAKIEWYGRGVESAACDEGWVKSSFFTGTEIMPSLSCSLYSIPEIERTRETYRRTCMLADKLKVKNITPWIALGSGYRRQIENMQKWDSDWDYDIIYSWMIGTEINQNWYSTKPKRFAAYNRSKVVVFYPGPFDKRTPHWTKHFIAYVRGATGINNLKDLENAQE